MFVKSKWYVTYLTPKASSFVLKTLNGNLEFAVVKEQSFSLPIVEIILSKQVPNVKDVYTNFLLKCYYDQIFTS